MLPSWLCAGPMTGLLKLRSTTLIRTTPNGSSATSRESPTTNANLAPGRIFKPHAICSVPSVTKKLNFLSHRPLFPFAILPLLFEGRFHPKSRTQGHRSPEDFWPAPLKKGQRSAKLWPHFLLRTRGEHPSPLFAKGGI